VVKKIGMVTWARGNMGSALQCYATQVVLSQLGYEGVLLERKEHEHGLRRLVRKVGRYLQFLVRCLRHPARLRNVLAVRSQARKSLEAFSPVAMAAIDKFAHEHVRAESASFGQLKRLARSSEYAAFVSGSDQIWNVAGPYLDPMAFLRFAPREKRIAFAPSFGTSNIPVYDLRELGKYISEYEYLSVREQSGAKIIKELTGREAEVLVDPTLQLDGDFWRQLSAQDSDVYKHDSKYLFLYFLNSPSSVALETIRQVKAAFAGEVLAVVIDHEEFRELKGYRFVDGGPLDFVSLIAGAALVCTDSLHGTIFSINLGIPFLTFDRQYGHYYKQTDRLLSILNTLHLDDRFMRDVPGNITDVLQLDFTEANRLLEAERQKALNYLSTALAGVEARSRTVSRGT
jgi:hypothetical protein